MSLSTWSPRRILLLWFGGLALQLALLVTPVWWAFSNAPRRQAEWDALSARWSIAERADSLSIAAQRASGATSVDPSGDSLFALVSMPSGRPTPAPVPTKRARGPQLFDALYLGGIPLILCLLTGLWWWRRPASQCSAQQPHPRAPV